MRTMILAATLIMCATANAQQCEPAVEATVKVILPRWTGSGWFCGSDDRGTYVATNAHVANQVGQAVTIQYRTLSGSQTVRGNTIFVAYSNGLAIDFALVRVPCKGHPELKLLTVPPDNVTNWKRKGSPGGQWPQVEKDFRDVRRWTGTLITGLPVAISGESGSPAWNTDGNATAQITWSTNGRAGAQSCYGIYNVIKARSLQVATPRPNEEMQELATTNRYTPDTLAWETSTLIENLPIWTDGTPDQPPPPEDECDLTDAERAIIQKIRELKTQQTATDWRKILIEIILLILRNLEL